MLDDGGGGSSWQYSGVKVVRQDQYEADLERLTGEIEEEDYRWKDEE